MKILLNNIGKIKEAAVEIKGITVIAGENDTGKSTVGKVLYCIFNSFYKISNQIKRERESNIYRAIASYLSDTDRIIHIEADPDFIRESIFKILIKTELLKGNPKENKNNILNFLQQIDQNFDKDKENHNIEQIVTRINEILQVSDDEIFKTVLNKRLYSEFNGQINNIYYPGENGIIQLTIRGDKVRIEIRQDQVYSISKTLSLETEIIYIDSPFIMDDYFPYLRGPGSNHRMHLIKKLNHTKEDNVINEIITTRKIDGILSELNKVCSGEIVKSTGTRGFGYKTNKSETLINVRNISTGLKTFVILKSLLLNGSLEENGTIIFDEPEIHLHPEWQLMFAELIVLLQKKFGMHILLTTHSPYFIYAIEVYSAKHDIADKCKYYLAENEGDKSIIKEVTNIEDIYEKLAMPLQELENKRFSND